MEERRLLVAVALSFLVLMGYRALFPPPVAPPVPPATATAPSGLVAPSAGAPTSTPPTLDPVVEPEPEAGDVAAVADIEERRVEVRAVGQELAFTNRGAAVVSWRLPRFIDERGRAEELVQPAPALRPLDLATGDAALDERLRNALFEPSATHIDIGDGPAELRFVFASGDIEAEKIFRFDPEGPLVWASAQVRQRGRALPAQLLWGPGLGLGGEETSMPGFSAMQVVYSRDGAVERIEVDDVAATPTARVGWAGVESLFFVAIFVPPDPATATFFTTEAPGTEAGTTVVRPVVGLPADSGVWLYVGPKDYHALAALGRGLEQVVPVGDWIGPIVVPLLALLRWVHGLVGSYGWAIVMLTVLINLVMAPLRHYSIANGLKMAKLSPEMKAIQERYRKVPALDPKRQEMQKEVGELYARHGMSMGTQMAVGCLPLLLTMPFLFAFYRVLTVSIDLRGAPFLWITDLSQKDPLYITPVLMGVSMLLMQKMMPTTMDPAQQRVMLIMPLVLVVMFFAAPAGLNLYWLASNVCSIVQQGITLRLLRDRPDDAPARAEKRGGSRR